MADTTSAWPADQLLILPIGQWPDADKDLDSVLA